MSKQNYITEEDLKFLGFKKFVEDGEGWDEPFYYYTHKIKGLPFITNADNECIKGRWIVELDDYPNIRFKNAQKLFEFIKLLQSLRK